MDWDVKGGRKHILVLSGTPTDETRRDHHTVAPYPTLLLLYYTWEDMAGRSSVATAESTIPAPKCCIMDTNTWVRRAVACRYVHTWSVCVNCAVAVGQARSRWGFGGSINRSTRSISVSSIFRHQHNSSLTCEGLRQKTAKLITSIKTAGPRQSSMVCKNACPLPTTGPGSCMGCGPGAAAPGPVEAMFD